MNALDNAGRTALHHAARHGLRACCLLLLEVEMASGRLISAYPSLVVLPPVKEPIATLSVPFGPQRTADTDTTPPGRAAGAAGTADTAIGACGAGTHD